MPAKAHFNAVMTTKFKNDILQLDRNKLLCDLANLLKQNESSKFPSKTKVQP